MKKFAVLFFAAGIPLSAWADVRSEAHQLLLSEIAPPPAAAPAAPVPQTPATAAAAAKPAPIALPPAPAVAVASHSENRVEQFFRTGILLSDHSSPDNPARKVSVGPCEGGQLLNFRSSW